jgi:hypothetical protein
LVTKRYQEIEERDIDAKLDERHSAVVEKFVLAARINDQRKIMQRFERCVEGDFLVAAIVDKRKLHVLLRHSHVRERRRIRRGRFPLGQKRRFDVLDRNADQIDAGLRIVAANQPHKFDVFGRRTK